MEIEENGSQMVEIALEEPQQEPQNEPNPEPPAQAQTQMQQEPEPGNDPPAEPKPEPMSAEERHRQAAARRAREDAERAAAHQAEIDAAYARAYAGQGDPYHGNRPIRTKADYDAYIQALHEDENRQRMEQMKESGVDPDMLQQLIRDAVNQNPIVQQASAAVQQANAAMQQAHTQQVKANIEQELSIIRGIDPEIKSADDLHDKCPDTWDRMLELCRKGVSLSEAYKLTNFDALMQKRGAASRQAAMNASATKAHLKSTKNNNQATVTMPRDVLEEFRRINPGKTDAEYAAYWAKHHNKE